MAEALRSGWISSGPKVNEFEAAFGDFLGGGVESVSVNSATAGLHLALEAVGVGPGDEVLVPAWTFTATAEVMSYLGAVPILVDVEPRSLNIDLEAAAARVSNRTRAIMPVHFAGLPVDPVALRRFAEAHSLRVIEDAAHSFPASAADQVVGTGTSDATVFSFYATKTMTTGEGGMVVTRNPDLAQRVRTMRLHGIDRDAFDRYRSTVPSWQYDVVAPGYKYNLTDPAAAMGLVQLSRAAAMRDRRAAIGQIYDNAFADSPLELPEHGGPGVRHAWHLYVVRTPPGVSRDDLIASLSSRGVGTSVHFIPLHLQPYWRDLGSYKPRCLPVASREFERVVSLPIYSGMSDAAVRRVADTVLELVST